MTSTKIRGGGGLICIYWWCHCYYVDEGGRGSENWQNLVDVIYGRPLLLNQKCSLERGNTIRALLCNIYFQYSAVLCNKQYWKLCIFYPHAKISASRTVWHIAHTMHIQLLGVTALQRTSELQNSSSKVRISATFLGETEFALNRILKGEQKNDYGPIFQYGLSIHCLSMTQNEWS